MNNRLDGYFSTAEAALRLGTSVRTLQRWISEGKIPGVKSVGNTSLIPADAERPVDNRKKQKQGSIMINGVNPLSINEALKHCGITTEYLATLIPKKELKALENKCSKEISRILVAKYLAEGKSIAVGWQPEYENPSESK